MNLLSFGALALICLAGNPILLGSGVTDGKVAAVNRIALTVGNLDEERRFFTNALPFVDVSASNRARSNSCPPRGAGKSKMLSAILRLGDEEIELIEFPGMKARPIPDDSRSFDRWFQHIAIVVSDMDRAYESLRAHRVQHISTAPQTLPDWNPKAGGIKAFYFEDPEKHPLELIWFPPGRGDARWQHPNSRLFLGIDHTAIVVSNTEKSLAFYRDMLGFRVAGESENWGVQQEHLNQVFGARLRITGLRADHGPGVEFLEYIAPPGGRPLPPNSSISDGVAWRTVISARTPGDLSAWIVEKSGVKLETEFGGRTKLFRDPDGHLVEVEPVVASDR